MNPKKLTPARCGAAAALLALALLPACGVLGRIGPTALQGSAVPLLYAESAPLQRPLAQGVTWEVTESPPWLGAEPHSGAGPLRLTLTANRDAVVPLPEQLSGELVITLGGDGSGEARFRVSADNPLLSGQVVRQVPAAPGVGVQGLTPASTADAAGSVIVKFRPGAHAAALSALPAAQALTDDLAVVPASDPGALARTLQARADVEYAVPNETLRAQSVPSQVAPPQLAEPLRPTTAFSPLQWYHDLLGMPAVWRDMTDSPYRREITVAVIDTGVRFDHPNLQGGLIGPGEGAFDFVGADGTPDPSGPDEDPTDPSENRPATNPGSHGTHVAGIIVANWNTFDPPCDGCSTSGVAGLVHTAPVKVLPLRSLSASGSGSVANTVLAVRYAAGETVTVAGVERTNPRPAQVINLSLGNPISAQAARPMCDAIADAAARGVLVIAAAGNGYGSTPYYPAACAGAVAVGSVGPGAALPTAGGVSRAQPRPAPYSQSFAAVQLLAPGGNTLTAHNGARLGARAFPDAVFSTSWNYLQGTPNYFGYEGTSQAVPMVSAVAALMLSKGVSTGAPDTLARLRETATPIPGEHTGAGMVNAARALAAPAVSNTLVGHVNTARGASHPVSFGPLGEFGVFLPHGQHLFRAGTNRSGSGLAGERGDPLIEREVDLQPGSPGAHLGTLPLP